jgi:hypothetical protein
MLLKYLTSLFFYNQYVEYFLSLTLISLVFSGLYLQPFVYLKSCHGIPCMNMPGDVQKWQQVTLSCPYYRYPQILHYQKFLLRKEYKKIRILNQRVLVNLPY